MCKIISGDSWFLAFSLRTVEWNVCSTLIVTPEASCPICVYRGCYWYLSSTIEQRWEFMFSHVISNRLSLSPVLLSVHQPHWKRQPLAEPGERVPLGVCAAERRRRSRRAPRPRDLSDTPGLRPHRDARWDPRTPTAMVRQRTWPQRSDLCS